MLFPQVIRHKRGRPYDGAARFMTTGRILAGGRADRAWGRRLATLPPAQESLADRKTSDK
ncbi:hypothetical protein FLW16_33465 [Microbispora sp. KK1-11]|nr:hypothetical protein FLW16_33465 [Microbispora sp. KK1-11]